jgi:kynurenine formamidase
VALKRCIVRAIKIDLTGKKNGEAIEPSDLEPYTGHIAQGCGVLLHTGWDKHFPDQSFF